MVYLLDYNKLFEVVLILPCETNDDSFYGFTKANVDAP